ncbi:three-Cys-motif partner protein TcmP [Micromonospora coerulea]|uniref:three-Cys-motif partner protein TcmP n=1 Tax=Micromonospora coerulea TaxID=47856 RepID=UPI0019052D11|nr:three-Cys-motif partner protein TcmP [Micromonospora veneta]
MPTPDEALWDKDPHTAAKHLVYRSYFDAWFPILLQSAYGSKGVTYAEGFSGPGEYKDGSSGSPIIALRSALGCIAPPRPGREGRFLLLEDSQARVDHLKATLVRELGTLDEVELAAHGLVVDPQKGSCKDDLLPLLDKHRVWNKPLLLVLDTWGSAVDFEILKRVAASKAGEVVVTIQPSQFWRFASNPRHYGDRVFGPVVWRDVQAQPKEKKAQYIKAQYRRVLNEAGFKYVLDFELADERKNLLYLVFGTNSDRGFEKMKDAIWRVDPYQGIGYRDPRDPNQETLPIRPEPQLGPLRRLILEYLTIIPGRATTLDELRRFTLHRTIFRPGQTLNAVRLLIDEGSVVAEPAGKRLIGTSRVSRTGSMALF